jgi:hypothetical protein
MPHGTIQMKQLGVQRFISYNFSPMDIRPGGGGRSLGVKRPKHEDGFHLHLVASTNALTASFIDAMRTSISYLYLHSHRVDLFLTVAILLFFSIFKIRSVSES